MGSARTRWLTGLGVALAVVAALLLMHGGSPSPGSSSVALGDPTSASATPGMAEMSAHPGMPGMPHGDSGGQCSLLLACCLAVLAVGVLLVLPRARAGSVAPARPPRPPRRAAAPAPPRPPVLSRLGVLRV